MKYFNPNLIVVSETDWTFSREEIQGFLNKMNKNLKKKFEKYHYVHQICILIWHNQWKFLEPDPVKKYFRPGPDPDPVEIFFLDPDPDPGPDPGRTRCRWALVWTRTVLLELLVNFSIWNLIVASKIQYIVLISHVRRVVNKLLFLKKNLFNLKEINEEKLKKNKEQSKKVIHVGWSTSLTQ